MSFLQILPLAFVMIAGPQIISSFFLATSERWAANSLAYVAGAGLDHDLRDHRVRRGQRGKGRG